MLFFASLTLLTADLWCNTRQQITKEVFSDPGHSLGLERGPFSVTVVPILPALRVPDRDFSSVYVLGKFPEAWWSLLQSISSQLCTQPLAAAVLGRGAQELLQ